MWPYIIRRLLLAIPTLLGVTVVVFLITRITPDAIMLICPSWVDCSYDPFDRIRDELGKPLYVQYFDWLFGILTLDFGRSFFHYADISSLLARKLPMSLQLGAMALTLGCTLGVVGGILAALKPDSIIDTVVRGISILGISLPTFFTGMILIIFLVRFFDWAPPTGYIPLTEDPTGNLTQFIWPALVVALGMVMGTVLRITRAALMEAMASDYVRLARGKGMREKVVVLRHALPNAMIPIVTVIGILAPIVLVGLVLTEQVFSLPGVGRELLFAINYPDAPVMGVILILSALLVILSNLVVDVLYARLDPRIRYQGGHIA